MHRTRWICLGLLTAFALPALLPFFSPHLYASADGQLHLYRLVAFHHQLSQGLWFTRWWPDLAYGYGFPLLIYYAPLAYYLTEPLLALGLAPALALNLSLGLALVLGAYGVYAWTFEIARVGTKHRAVAPLHDASSLQYAALLAAVAFLYAPYLLFNALARANLAEAWALAFAPWALWAWTRRASGDKSAWSLAFVSLLTSAVFLSHNVTGLLFGLFLVGYIVATSGLIRRSSDREASPARHSERSEESRISPNPGFLTAFYSVRNDRRSGRLWRDLAVLALATGLAAIFLLPALLEQSYVQIARVIVTPDFDFHYNFVAAGDLLAWLPRADTGRLNTLWPPTLGLPQALLALVGWVAVASSELRVASALRKSLNRPIAESPLRRITQSPNLPRFAFYLLLYLAAAALALILLMLPIALPVWERLPFLAFVQHPARLRGLVALALAPLAGLPVLIVPTRVRAAATAGLVALIALAAFPLLYPRLDPAVASTPTLRTMFTYEAASGALGTTSFGEYLPVWAEDAPDHSPLEAQYATRDIPARFVWPDSARVLESSARPTGATARVQAPAEARVVYRSFYFPGWQARVDGQPVLAQPTARDGLLSFDLPRGEHTVEVVYTGTLVENLAGWISAACTLFLAASCLWIARRKGNDLKAAGLGLVPASGPGRGQDGGTWLAAGNPRRAEWGVIVLTALALLVLRVYGDGASTAFVMHFNAARADAVAPRALNASFGGEVILLGTDAAERSEAHAGETIHLTLYWRAAHPLDRSYAAAVHLLDASGLLVAQSDHVHPANLPTIRWDPGSYVADQHSLALPGPGTYTVMVRTYDPATNRRLVVSGEDGLRIGEVVVR